MVSLGPGRKETEEERQACGIIWQTLATPVLSYT